MKSTNQTKITGFFGFFDILGFKEILDKNSLDYLCDIIGPILDTLDNEAITMGGIDPSQGLCLHQTNTLVFSDTIILYEKASQMSNGLIPSIGATLIDKAAVLSRLAFENGVPLRGAISFGEYVVNDRYFLGKPIHEACVAEKKCNWSGVILCDSAIKKMQQQPPIQRVNWRGMENVPIENNPFRQELIVNDYRHPTGKISQYPALRWDDILKVRQYVPELKKLNGTEDNAFIHSRVKNAFSQHNKDINNEKTERKIENTFKFLVHCKNIPLSVRLQYIPSS